MTTWIWILILSAIGILIIYFIGSIASEGSIIKSLWVQSSQNIEAENVYYLATACLLIKATAKVIVTKNATTSNIIDAKLAELAFDTSVQVVPDTHNVFAIRYISSWFSNDDLKFSINSSGLIEGINLSAEDRISNIIAQVTEAPKIILSGEQAAESRTLKTEEGITEDREVVITETKEYTNNFLILTEEIRARTSTRKWLINVDGTANADTTVDASFNLKFEIPTTGSFTLNDKSKEFVGILTRPLQTIIMGVYKDSASPTADVKYQIVVPDESRVVSIPVKRSAFVKKMYGLKMANGMLAENTINKPSEMEGFISIPIKIAKAIVSIPAQLLSFKIENIKRQTTFETEQQNLLKAQLLTKKNEISLGSELLKTKLDSHKTMLSYDAEIAKTKLEAEKALIVAQKDTITANKDLVVAKKDWENAKKELEELLKRIEEAKKPS